MTDNTNNDNTTAPNPDRGVVNLRGKKGKFNLFLLIIPVFFILMGLSLLVVSKLNSGSSTDSGVAPLNSDLSINTPADRTNKASLTSNQDEIRRQLQAIKAREQRQKEKTAEKTTPLPAPLPTPQQPTATNPNGEKVVTPYERKQQGNVLLVFQGQGSSNNNSSSGVNNHNSFQDDNTSLNSELNGTTFANGYARVRNNVDFLLIHGTSIPCVLKTKVVTEYKSLLSCQISKDIYSANGKVLLFEKGSMVSGEQRSALLRGKARVFVVWTDVETTNNVSVRIDSLGTDTLGASGHEAWIDTHFKERFGGALLLSFIDFGFQYAENKASENNSNNGFTFNNTSNNPSDLASKALENSINIPDTGYINQGDLLNILVARDIDFQNIYSLRYANE